jgi:hypothetical protein
MQFLTFADAPWSQVWNDIDGLQTEILVNATAIDWCGGGKQTRDSRQAILPAHSSKNTTMRPLENRTRQ